ncbi:MAG: hypothetical protein KJ718_00160 [Nanoarchaeota archaeon]|nr:hypothetical protein [Nanoarchaeota archaeon]MBU1050953.1 hypothetical protein [Nanoarchaeota archaeon]
MTKIEFVARYRKKDLNPFRERFGRDGDFGRITGTVDESVSQEELERHAREATPQGYGFIEVVRSAEER